MITGIRSALLSDDVTVHPDGRVDLIGLHGGALITDTRPGVVSAWLMLIIELDGKATDGQVVLTADDYLQTVPFSSPAGLKLTTVAFPFIAPVLRSNALVASIVDTQRRGKPLKVRWDLRIAEGATEVSPHAAEDLLRTSELSVDMLAADLAKQRNSQH